MQLRAGIVGGCCGTFGSEIALACSHWIRPAQQLCRASAQKWHCLASPIDMLQHSKQGRSLLYMVQTPGDFKSNLVLGCSKTLKSSFESMFRVRNSSQVAGGAFKNVLGASASCCCRGNFKTQSSRNACAQHQRWLRTRCSQMRPVVIQILRCVSKHHHVARGDHRTLEHVSITQRLMLETGLDMPL